MACRDMLRAGLNCVEYSNGARHTLSDYAEMAIRTANKRAYLRGEGEKRKKFGITTVVVNSRQGGCPDCAPYIGRVFIDDVYSGGSAKDGKYPLLSEAISGGLFHPRCKDSTSTFYEGITTLEPATPKEIDEMRERETLETRQKYCENQAEKCHRISKYSLDSGNKRAYASRAQTWEDKAEETAEKLSETVAKSEKSGIIELNRKANRKEQNNGAFSNLEIPMQKRYVQSICKKYGVDTQGITFKIQRSEKFLSTFYYGSTDYNNIGRIDLFPNAFSNEEELIRTVLHEKCHYEQLLKYGKKYVQDNLSYMEKVAYRYESIFYKITKKRAK